MRKWTASFESSSHFDANVKQMSSPIDALTGSIESRDSPQLSSNVQHLFRSIAELRDSGGVIPALVAAVNVLKEPSDLPELRCNFGLVIRIVEVLQGLSEVA